MTVFLGIWISCCSGFALRSFDQGLNLFFHVERRGQGACFCVYEGLSVRRGIWPDVVHIARELWMAFLRVWLTTPPQPGALSSSRQNLRCSLTLSVLPLGPQPPVPEKRPPEVQHFRMSDDVHSLGKVTSGQSHPPPTCGLLWPVLRA